MKILANDGLHPVAIAFLQEEGFEVLDNRVAQEQLIPFINENQVEVLLVRSATQVQKDVLEGCPGLRIIGRAGVGMDNIDVALAQKLGKQVINTPGASSKSVAELAIAHMFTLARYLHDSNRQMPLEGETQFKALKKSYTNATELSGKTLGVIGFGRIGTETVKLALAMGMRVIVHDPSVTQDRLISLDFFDGQTIDFTISPASKEELLSESDYVSLHIPAQKVSIIGKKELELMKPSAFIINVSRGGLIDEKALVEALNNDVVKGAGLDVFENEPTPAIQVLMNSKISLSPHIGGNTQEAQERIGLELAEQVVSIYRGETV